VIFTVDLICGKFIRIDSYDAEALGKSLRDVTPNRLQCPTCKATWTYQRGDVAHSRWRDGREPLYPQR